jgi:starvation-inducible DNA-binding protein
MFPQIHEKENTAAETSAARLAVLEGFSAENLRNLSSVLNASLCYAFALYHKTRNLQGRMSGQHFRDCHLLLDEHVTETFAVTADIAEHVHKVGGSTLRSVGHLAQLQHVAENDGEFTGPSEMMKELHFDNKVFAESLRTTREVANEAKDYATIGLIEVWIDEAERRARFLSESTHRVCA